MNKNIVYVDRPIFWINLDNPHKITTMDPKPYLNAKMVMLQTYLVQPKPKNNQILYVYIHDNNRCYLFDIPIKLKLKNLLNKN